MQAASWIIVGGAKVLFSPVSCLRRVGRVADRGVSGRTLVSVDGRQGERPVPPGWRSKVVRVSLYCEGRFCDFYSVGRATERGMKKFSVGVGFMAV